MGRSGRPMTSHFIRPQRGELFTPLTNYVSVNRIISGLGRFCPASISREIFCKYDVREPARFRVESRE